MDGFNNNQVNFAHQNDNISSQDNSAEDVIQTIADALSSGELDKAKNISNDLWSKGGELSSKDMAFYTSCLLDMGEIERVGILLKPILQEMSAYIDDYWDIILKYGFLSNKLSLAFSVIEYPQIYDQMKELADWLKQHEQDLSFHNYEHILEIAFNNIRNNLCAFDMVVLENNVVACLFYSSLNEDENQKIAQNVSEDIEKYFEKSKEAIPQDFYISFDNISNSGNLFVGSDD